MDLSKLTRRQFMKYSAMLGTALATGCSFNSPSKGRLLQMGLDSAGVDVSGFELYNGNNEFQKAGRQKFTYRTKLDNPAPAPAFYVNGGLDIIAAADGRVADIYKITQGEPTNRGGWTVEVSDPLSTPFRLMYYHVDEPVVELMEPVKRGQILAKGVSNEIFSGGGNFPYFKMALKRWHNLEDPDNYGEGHGHMNYWDGETDINVGDGFRRDSIQRRVITDIVDSYNGNPNPLKPLAIMSEVEHKPRASRGANTYRWSAIERFRFLDHINTKNPGIFDITESEYKDLKDEFYANQPVILTLPFKK